jgi:hypothetical protein
MYKNEKGVPLHAMEALGRTGNTAPTPPALEGGEWSASCPGRFTPRERTLGTHCKGSWMGPRAGWRRGQRKILCPCRGSMDINIYKYGHDTYHLHHNEIWIRLMEARAAKNFHLKREHKFRVENTHFYYFCIKYIKLFSCNKLQKYTSNTVFTNSNPLRLSVHTG